jgi:hypothetical protein
MGLLKTVATVAVASSVHGRIQRRQQQRWAHQDAMAAQAAEPYALGNAAFVGAPMPPPPAPAASDHATQLQLLAQLGELRRAGVLTEAEFEVKKAAILQGH